MNKQQQAFIDVAERVASELKKDKHDTNMLYLLSFMYETAQKNKLAGGTTTKIKEMIRISAPYYYEGYFNKPKSNRVKSAIPHDNN